MAQMEQDWTMENTKQLEDKQTKNIKTKRETIKRQRQLTCQVMEEIEQLWEETQRDRNEINYLKKKTEQQQEDIAMLTAEKHEQYILIKRLRLELESLIDKLEENKNESSQEKNLVAIYQERETLKRRHTEIMNERRKLEIIKYNKTKSQDSKEPEEPLEQIKQGLEMMERLMAESLLSLMNKNQKVMLEAKQAKEQMEKNMADIKQELKKNKQYITQHRDQIEHIKHSMNVNVNKMKQRWTEIQRDVQMQKAIVPEIESRERQKEGKGNFDTVKIKLCIILEEMEKLWDVLEDSGGQLEVTLRDKQELKTETVQMESMNPDTQKPRHEDKRQDIDVSMHITQWETEMKGDMQRQNNNENNRK